jgi:hypothetical protein
MYFGHFQHRPSSRSRKQSGYMLIVLIFLMVGLTIASLWTAPAIAAAIQRDKEEEMIHRGVQYTRAIQKYYKKFGRYPGTIEQLEDTNHMRFLRKRYKDPFAPDGKWQLVRFGQVSFNATQIQGGGGSPMSGGGAALPNLPGVTGMIQGQGGATFGGGSTFGNSNVGGTNSFNQQPNGTGVTGNVPGLTGSGSFGSSSNAGGASQPQTTGDSNSSAFGSSNTGAGSLPTGGSAIIGVASVSSRKSLRVVNDKDHYKDWKFVYDPTLDRGGLIKGPYDPKKQLGRFAGANASQGIGQPIGSQQQGSSFNNGSNFNNGQSSFGNNGSFGQPLGGGFGQPIHPPDQNANPH